MIDSIIIVGVTALLIQIAQTSIEYFKSDVGKMWLKLIMFMLVGVFNVLNGIAFGGAGAGIAMIAEYFKNGLILGAAASGIYGIGKEITNNAAEYQKQKRLRKEKEKLIKKAEEQTKFC